MRYIILDTETTGLTPGKHRIIEVACLELLDSKLTNDKYHSYFNPEIEEMPLEAFSKHNISIEFLKDKPLFKQEATALIDFIGESPVIAHNADFDINMLNAELDYINMPKIKSKIICTLNMAKTVHASKKKNLDALCDYYKIDRSHRNYHDAIGDCELLAQVYVAMLPEYEKKIIYKKNWFEEIEANLKNQANTTVNTNFNQIYSQATIEETQAHLELLNSLKTHKKSSM